MTFDAFRDIQADKRIPSAFKQLDPFDAIVAVAKTRNAKHAQAILNDLAKVLHDVDKERDVVLSLRELSTLPDAQLRVLQLLPQLFRRIPSDDNLAICLEIPVRLSSNIASATLQQLLVELFDNTPTTREAVVSRIFEDLCATYDGRQTGFVDFPGLKKGLLLEIVESILASGSSLLKAHPSLLDANLVPSLLTNDVFSIQVRKMRVIALLLPGRLSLLESLDFDDVLVLEAIESARLPESMLLPIATRILEFEDQIPALGTYSICTAPVRNDQVSVDGLVLESTQEGLGEWCQPKRLLSQLSLSEAPSYNPNYKMLLILQIVLKLSRRPSTIARELLTLQSAFLSSSLSVHLEELLFEAMSQTIIALESRSVFLRRLGRMATSSSNVNHRSLSAMSTFVRTIKVIQSQFDVDTWTQVLEVLQSAETILAQKSVVSPEVSKVSTEIDEFFDINACSIEALCRTTYGMNKLKLMIPQGVSRIDDVALFDHLSNAIAEGHVEAAEAVQLFIEQAIHDDPSDRIIRAIGILQGEKMQVIQLQTLLTVLEVIGHDLTSGWHMILQLVHDAVDVRLGFTCLQLICNNYLSSMKDETMLLIDTIARFSLQSNLQISLSAIAQFWIVLDSLPDDREIWLRFMRCLVDIAKDERAEIRSSAVQICFRTIERTEQDSELWSSAVNIVLKELHLLARSSPEFVKAITIGTSRVIQNEMPLELWETLFMHFDWALTHSQNAPTALLEIKDILDGVTIDIWDCAWSAMERGPVKDLSQESIAIYVDILHLLYVKRRHEIIPLLDICLKYPTYYPDIDNLSIVQKAVIACLSDLQEFDVVSRTAHWLALPLSPGKSTFVAFTYAMIEFVHGRGGVEVVTALNQLIEVRYSKIGTKRYDVWQTATEEVLSIASRALSDIWPELITTAKLLMTPHKQSEEFVQTSLNTLRSIIIPIPEEHCTAYAQYLYDGSLFYDETVHPDLIIREWCLLELLRLCISESPIADAVLPHTIKRTTTVVSQFISSSETRLHAPLKPHLMQELEIVLDHLGDDIQHANQRVLLRECYTMIVDALLITRDCHRAQGEKILVMLKGVLSRVAQLL